jgi:hypothetical protein
MTTTSPYSDWDMNTLAYRAQEMMSSMKEDTSAGALDAIQQDAVNANYQDLSNAVSDVNVNQVRYDANFQVNTNMLAMMNESWNSNRYIATTLNSESKRVDKLDSQAKRDIYKLRQEQMYYTNRAEYYAFGSRVIIFTMFVTLLAFIPASMWVAGKLSSIIVAVSVGVVLLIYLMILVLAFAVTAKRRKSDWNQFYWRKGDTVTAATEGGGAGGSCS